MQGTTCDIQKRRFMKSWNLRKPLIRFP